MRDIPPLVYWYYFRRSWWPVLHATCDHSPGRKLHPGYSLEPNQLLDILQKKLWYIWIGVYGWSQWVSSVVTVYPVSSIHRSYSLTAMTATLMIGPHIFSDTTTSPHLSSRPETPPMTSQIIMVTTSIWRYITEYKNWNVIDIMDPWNLLLPKWIMFLWRCGICFNNNPPLSSLTP